MESAAPNRNYTIEVGKFVEETEFKDLPRPVVERAKLAILDALGIAIGAYGTSHQVVRALIDMTTEVIGAERSTIIGAGKRTSSLDAAMVNAVLTNFLDFSDGHYAGGHINDRVVPAALSLAEHVRSNGEQLITSVALAYEVYIRLAYSLFKTSESVGRIPYFVALGPIASAIASGKLLNLDQTKLAGAIGLASSIQICGAQYARRGGHEKDLTPGHEARRGVFSALLSRQGVLGSTDMLEGSRGLCRAISDQGNLEELTDKLGERYKLDECYFKPYPACRYLHASIEAALRISNEYNVEPNSIRRVTIRTNTHSATRSNRDIQSHVSAIFSHEYQTVSALLHKKPLLPTQWRENMQNQLFVNMLEKTRVEIDPSFNEQYQRRFDGGATWPSSVLVNAEGGAEYEATVIHPKGDPENPLTKREIAEKFLSLTAPLLGDAAHELLGVVEDLEHLDDVRVLSQYIAVRGTQSRCNPDCL